MADLMAAPATALFHSSRAILRVSGGGALALGAQLLNNSQAPLKAGVWRGAIALSGASMPAEVWAFAEGRSFTGEESIEIHLPGSPVLVEMLLEKLRSRGVRDAEAGEFTRRAYLNGKLDLAQAEAVMALVSSIDADGAARARRLLEGSFSKRIAAFVAELETLCARFEVAFDFDEEAAEQVDEDRFRDALASLADDLAQIRRRGFPQSVERARVVLVGASNVGKSTLFNAVLGSARAAVADEAGTTRDDVAVEIEIEGVPLALIDSAGLLRERNQIEAASIARTLELAESADLVLAIIAAQDDGEALRPLLACAGSASVIVVRTMLDRSPALPMLAGLQGYPEMRVCAPRGDGVPELRLAIAQALRQRMAPEALPVTARAAGAIHHAAESLAQAREAFAAGMPLEVASDMTRAALSDLRSFLGDQSGGDVLDVVFASFCIGK